ncbi:MAG: hypothetical protein ABIH71_00665 [Candidatus Omnitrophota bacterium]|nr:hypothetical protein [Candidatus Omnitrophota bacterium]
MIWRCMLLLFGCIGTSFFTYGAEYTIPAQIVSLSQCKDIASKNYLPLQIARDEVVLATLKITEAKRNLFPSAAIKYQENKGTIDNNPFTGKRYDLELK